MEIPLPEGAVAGDVLSLTHWPDRTWKVKRQSTTFAFVLPECQVGDVLKREVPDGTVLSFVVPEGLEPGELVTLTLQEDEWALDKVYVLPDTEAVPQQSESIVGPYVAALGVIRESGHLSRLPMDSNGILQVSVPFCGRFQEYALLGSFLAEACLPLPGVKGIRVLGTEFLDRYYYDWAVAQKWYREHQPQLQLHLCVRDLAENPLPHAALTIGLHPEVTKGGCWFAIVGSVVRSTRGGLCLFATFFEDEVQTVLNMIDMYKSEGTTVEVVANPYYGNGAGLEGGVSPRMCHLILVRG